LKSLLLIAVSVLLVSSVIMVLTPAVAAPPSNIPPADKDVVPPGLTRVTVIHEMDRTRTIVDHGPGIVPPPRQQTSFACTDTGEDTCDTNSFTGKKWFNLPVNYFVNLEGSGDDGFFLAAVKAGSQVWEDGANSSFDQEFIDVTTLKASGAQKRQMDGFNVVDWGNTKKFGFSVIAVTVFWYFTSTGEIVEADFRYNQDFSWSSNNFVPNDPRDPADNFGDPASMDVQNIGAHEFGHFHAALFDITDSSASALTMYAFGALGETQKRTLGVGDQLSIETAYPPNNPPVANAGGTYEGTEDISIEFDGSSSSDINGDLLSYSWDFGDSSPLGTGVSPSHTYLSGGTFDVTLTVSDGRGGSDTATTAATVTGVNDDPVSDPNGPYSGIVNEPINFDGSGSSDFDGDTLSYSWDFGDGIALGTGVSLTHTYTSIAEFTVTLLVSDGNGGSDSASTKATVTDQLEAIDITSISRDVGNKGEVLTDVMIGGSGFDPGVSVSMENGAGPTPKISVTEATDTSITITITIKDGGPPRDRTWDVRVTNPDGSFDVLVNGFTVHAT